MEVKANTASLSYWCHLGASTLVLSLAGQMHFVIVGWMQLGRGGWMNVMDCD